MLYAFIINELHTETEFRWSLKYIFVAVQFEDKVKNIEYWLQYDHCILFAASINCQISYHQMDSGSNHRFLISEYFTTLYVDRLSTSTVFFLGNYSSRQENEYHHHHNLEYLPFVTIIFFLCEPITTSEWLGFIHNFHFRLSLHNMNNFLWYQNVSIQSLSFAELPLVILALHFLIDWLESKLLKFHNILFWKYLWFFTG